MAVHVLHGDPAPHADHKRFDFALVGAASDAEEAVLAPVLPPGVGGDLQRRGCGRVAERKQEVSENQMPLSH